LTLCTSKEVQVSRQLYEVLRVLAILRRLMRPRVRVAVISGRVGVRVGVHYQRKRVLQRDLADLGRYLEQMREARCKLGGRARGVAFSRAGMFILA